MSLPVSFAFMILLWHGSALVLDLPFFPGPLPVSLQMYKSLASGTLLLHLLISLGRVLAALTLSFIPAFFLGIGAGRNGRADRVISPGIYLLYPVPKVALLPVILLFLGMGNVSKVFFVALIVFFPFYMHIRDQAAGLERQYFDAMKSLGGRRTDTFLHLLLPALLPGIFSSLRINLGTGLAVLFLAETFATRRGIGWYIMDAWSMLAYETMYAGILALSLTGFFLYKLIDFTERFVCPWKSENHNH